MYYEDAHVKLYNKDCRSKDELPDESVQCVVTSPPYWGLRKYSGEQGLIWGGDKQCNHEWGSDILGDTRADNFKDWGNNGSGIKAPHIEVKQGNFCQLCGAWRGAYGLEPTPEMYVEHTVEILREIRRVLRKDGVVFWNCGDSYYSSPSNQQGRGVNGSNAGNRAAFENIGRRILPRHSNLKPKDLCLTPFRVAIAAQEDGWWVRSDIIWNKPNPMPESVTDRPTNSHEYILMLTKSAKYYWDADAVREEAQPHMGNVLSNRNSGTGIARGMNGQADRQGNFESNPLGRNIRSVWTFPTQPYPEAHFAVFPEKLPELCIKAATPEVGCCPDCGTPWERVTERENMKIRRTDWNEQSGNRTGSAGTMIEPARAKTLHWQPTCKCNPDWKESKVYPTVPSLVLDPFAGAGTTLWVAKKLNRRAVGYELSEEYCRLTVDRLRQQVML